MPEYTDFIEKTQREILSAVKQAQETNLKAMNTFSEAVAEYAGKARNMAAVSTMPTPAEMIESTFGFTAALIELQKNYYVRIAESIAAASKKAGEFAHTAESAHTAKKSEK